MMLLSFGFGPGLHGGKVKAMLVLLEVMSGSLRKETLERPFSVLRVVRCENFVRLGSADLRKENIATGIQREESVDRVSFLQVT